MRILLLMLVGFPAMAQMFPFPGPGLPSGGGGPTITLIAHNHAVTTGTAASVTVNCTGANGYFIEVNSDHADTATVGDGGTDTFSLIVTHSDTTSAGKSALWAATNVVGASRTFTVTATFVSFEIACFSTLNTSPADANGGTSNITAGGVPFPCGSLTPGGSNYLILAGPLWSSTSAISAVDSSFTLLDATPFVGGTNYGGALAYKITSGAENPNFSAIAGSGSCDMTSWKH